MSFPRSLIGSIFAMARPRRPKLEADLVCEAAEIIHREKGKTAVRPVARTIAERVADTLLRHLDHDPEDRISHAIATFEQQFAPQNPFVRLATSSVVDTLADFMRSRIDGLTSRAGRFLADHERRDERHRIRCELADRLARRYAETLIFEKSENRFFVRQDRRDSSSN